MNDNNYISDSPMMELGINRQLIIPHKTARVPGRQRVSSKIMFWINESFTEVNPDLKGMK